MTQRNWKLVLAETYRHFTNFMQEQLDLYGREFDPKQYRCITQAHQLYGMRGDEIELIELGIWYRGKDQNFLDQVEEVRRRIKQACTSKLTSAASAGTP